MQYTENLHLNKPEQDDFYDIENENENMDILDGAFKNKLTAIKIQTADELPVAREEIRGIVYHITLEDRLVMCIQTKPITYEYKNIEFSKKAIESPPTELDIYYLNTTSNTFYHSVQKDIALIEKEFISLQTLPEKGTYGDGTYIVIDGTLLYMAKISESSGYVAFDNFHVGEPAIYEDDMYYFIPDQTTHMNKLYYYNRFKWEEIEVSEVDILPEKIADISGKYYSCKKNYILKDGVILDKKIKPITTSGYPNGSYVEGEGFKATGSYLFVLNIKYVDMIALGYTKLKVRYKAASANGQVSLYGNATYSNVYSNSGTAQSKTTVVCTEPTELEYSIMGWSALTTTYLSYYMTLNNTVIVDMWFEKDDVDLFLGYTIGKTFDWDDIGASLKIIDGDTGNVISKKKGDVLLPDNGEVPETSYGLGYTLKTYEEATD